MTTRDDIRIQVLEEFACAAGWRDTDVVYWGSHREIAAVMLAAMQSTHIVGGISIGWKAEEK